MILVGSIDISNGIGQEVIVRYTTNLQTKGAMFADSNGREMLLRQRDFRGDFFVLSSFFFCAYFFNILFFQFSATWDLDLVSQPVARNYFPVNAAATIKDASHQLTVLVDRSEGVASLTDGAIEFMLHRSSVFSFLFFSYLFTLYNK